MIVSDWATPADLGRGFGRGHHGSLPLTCIYIYIFMTTAIELKLRDVTEGGLLSWPHSPGQLNRLASVKAMGRSSSRVKKKKKGKRKGKKEKEKKCETEQNGVRV